MGALNFGLSNRLKENYTSAPLFSMVWDTLRYIKVLCSIDFWWLLLKLFVKTLLRDVIHNFYKYLGQHWSIIFFDFLFRLQSINVTEFDDGNFSLWVLICFKQVIRISHTFYLPSRSWDSLAINSTSKFFYLSLSAKKKSWKIIFIDYFFSLLRICHARGIWADEYLGIKWPTI